MTIEVQRKLTTVLAADAEGYSREMDADEVRALGALRDARVSFPNSYNVIMAALQTQQVTG